MILRALTMTPLSPALLPALPTHPLSQARISSFGLNT